MSTRTFGRLLAGAAVTSAIAIIIFLIKYTHNSMSALPPDPAQYEPASCDSTEIARLVATIDKDADWLHNDVSPSSEKLVDCGLAALPHVLPLMAAEDEMTRMRAQRVLERVTQVQYGYRPGAGWSDKSNAGDWRKFWNDHGDLRWDAPLENRMAAITLWRAWLLRVMG